MSVRAFYLCFAKRMVFVLFSESGLWPGVKKYDVHCECMDLHGLSKCPRNFIAIGGGCDGTKLTRCCTAIKDKNDPRRTSLSTCWFRWLCADK